MSAIKSSRSRRNSRKFVWLFFLPLSLAIALTSNFYCQQSELNVSDEEKAAVQKTFRNFKIALMNKNGRGVVNLTSTKTLEYYLKLRNLALTSYQDELTQEPLSVQIIVLRIRAQFKSSQLRSLNSPTKIKRLLQEIVRKGWCSKDNMAPVGIGLMKKEISDEGVPVISAIITSNGAPIPPEVYRFRLEENT